MISQARHSVDKSDIAAVSKILAGDFLTRGPLTVEFEDRVAEICGKKYCVAMANGTVALHAALLACGAKHVVSPTLTFSAIANATHYAGAKLYLKHVDMAIFSFHPIKTITTGEGGCIVTDNTEYVTELRRIRNNGLENWQQHRWGLNYHISEIEVALGLSQLKRLDKIIVRRRELAQRYTIHWAGDERLILPADDDGHAWHLYVIRLTSAVKVKRDTFRKELAGMGVGTQVNYRPLHQQPIVASVIDSSPAEFPNADWRRVNHRCHNGL